MNIAPGTLVKALAGRDKGSMFVALEQSGGFVTIADGKTRKLEKPKRKSIKHISPAKAQINIEGLTNKRLRRALSEHQPNAQEGAQTRLHGENDCTPYTKGD